MQILNTTQSDFRSVWNKAIATRQTFAPQIESQAGTIVADVAERGDDAVIDHAGKIDNVALSPDRFAVSADEFEQANASVNQQTAQAILRARDNIWAYAEAHRPDSWSFAPRSGVEAGEQFHPLDNVGVYVPGGTAPLVSSVLHTVTIAKAAGVKDVYVTTPCGKNGAIHPEILFAAEATGASKVFRLGGVYAIAALAFGTATVPRVQKIAGPGNAYVTAAKRQVYGHVAIDLVAGPSEILLIADHTADPVHVAADMLSQAEHGSGLETVALLTDSRDVLREVQAELDRQKAELARKDTVDKVLENGTYLVHTQDLSEAVDLANEYAPEHLAIITEDASAMAKRITAAGAIFLGPWTPEPIGDFIAGPSHVLPTGGTAKYFSGLTVDSFMRRTSVLSYSKEALQREATDAMEIADSEGLTAHRKSIEVRR